MKKRILWDLLQSMQPFTSGLFWPVICDFNEISEPEERRGSAIYSHGGSSEFNEVIDQALLSELRSMVENSFGKTGN